MFDADLADLYEVPTKALNQALRRNLERFPEDFAFQLSKDELENWRSQIDLSAKVAAHGWSTQNPLLLLILRGGYAGYTVRVFQRSFWQPSMAAHKMTSPTALPERFLCLNPKKHAP
jgi:hypothetical protein